MADVFRHRGFAVYWSARFLSAFSAHFVSVAIGWHIYELTRDPFDLGLVGLCQFLPFPLLIFATGAVADRFDRRRIMAACLVVQAALVGGLILLVAGDDARTWPYFAIMFSLGAARAFQGPATQSMVPNLVPPDALSTAIAYNSSSWQIASILGPVIGGLLYGLAPTLPFAAAAVALLVSLALTAQIPPMTRAASSGAMTWQSLSAGFRYIWREKVVLGAISLDLFAFLLGGSVALLPAYASDILDVGPLGLGLLRSASGIGAIAVALYLARWPIADHAGKVMFVGVAAFGLFTVVFGTSALAWLSIVALFLMGAADMLSVYIRETLIQLWTPDQLRGRVNAVNMVFIGASNELGAFRAGVMAAWIGVVPAVVVGGLGTMLVAALWYRWFPALRAIRRFDRVAR